MNILHCPSGSNSKDVKEKLKNAGINFAVVQKESGSTVRFFTETGSYKGAAQINEFIQSSKSS